jgi:hypothetical protein
MNTKRLRCRQRLRTESHQLSRGSRTNGPPLYPIFKPADLPDFFAVACRPKNIRCSGTRLIENNRAPGTTLYENRPTLFENSPKTSDPDQINENSKRAKTLSPSFSTRGVGGPGRRSRRTSWLKGLYHNGYARLSSSNSLADLIRLGVRPPG